MAAVVPCTLEDGRRVDVRAVLAYLEPARVVHGATLEETGRTWRRIRAALETAGYVVPVRRLEVAALEALEDVQEVRRGRPGALEVGAVLEEWPEGATLAAAVAVAVGAGQIPPARVALPVPAGRLEDGREMVGAGYRYVQPRRGVRLEDVAGAVAAWDRAALVALEARRLAAAGRLERGEALAAMRRAGCTWVDVARLTGYREERLREILEEHGRRDG